jgi:hypothetical protein
MEAIVLAISAQVSLEDATREAFDLAKLHNTPVAFKYHGMRIAVSPVAPKPPKIEVGCVPAESNVRSIVRGA